MAELNLDDAFDASLARAFPSPEEQAQRRGYLAQVPAGIQRGVLGFAASPFNALSAIPGVRNVTEPIAKAIESRQVAPSGGYVEQAFETATQSGLSMLGTTGVLGAAGALAKTKGLTDAALRAAELTNQGRIAAGVGGLYGAAQVTETRGQLEKYNEVWKAQGIEPLTPLQIYAISLGAGGIEALGETLGDKYLLRAFGGAGTHEAADAVKRTLLQRFLPKGLALMKDLSPEVLTEVGQAVGETAAVRQGMGQERLGALEKAGMAPPTLTDAGTQVIVPTILSAGLQAGAIHLATRQPMSTPAGDGKNAITPEVKPPPTAPVPPQMTPPQTPYTLPVGPGETLSGGDLRTRLNDRTIPTQAELAGVKPPRPTLSGVPILPGPEANADAASGLWTPETLTRPPVANELQGALEASMQRRGEALPGISPGLQARRAVEGRGLLPGDDAATIAPTPLGAALAPAGPAQRGPQEHLAPWQLNIQMPPEAHAPGDQVHLLSLEGTVMNEKPYTITGVQTGPDGKRYATFAESQSGWPLDQLERAEAPVATGGVPGVTPPTSTPEDVPVTVRPSTPQVIQPTADSVPVTVYPQGSPVTIEPDAQGPPGLVPVMDRRPPDQDGGGGDGVPPVPPAPPTGTPPVVPPTPSLRTALQGATRDARIGGEVITSPDPIAAEVLASPSYPQVEAWLAPQIQGDPVYVGGGAGSVVLDIGGDRVARMGRGTATPLPNIPEVLQPLAQQTLGDLRVEIFPKVETAGITEAEVQQMHQSLAAQGYAFSDAGTDNLGRLPDGRLVVIDPGAVSRAPEAPVPAAAPSVPQRPNAQAQALHALWQQQGEAGVPDAPAAAPEAPAAVAPAQGNVGRESRVVTPRNAVARSLGRRDLRTVFRVVEADDLLHSMEQGYPTELQTRADRSPNTRLPQADEARAATIANAPDFYEVADSRQAETGAPIVTAHGPKFASISGTLRLYGLKRAYAFNAEANGYRTDLQAEAAQYGIDPAQVAAMRKPILVRELTEPLSRDQMIEFADEANAPNPQAKGAISSAVQDATKLTPELLSMLSPNEAGIIDLKAAGNRTFIYKFYEDVLAPSERGTFFLNGVLTPEGAARLERAIFAKAYGNSPALGRLAEDHNPDRKSVAQGMLTAAPAFARFQAAMDAGDAFPRPLTSDITLAANKLVALGHEGKTVAKWLDDQANQAALFDEHLTPLAKDLIVALDRPTFKRYPSKVADLFHTYIEAVYAAGQPGGMFTQGEPPSAAALLRAARDHVEAGHAARRPLVLPSDAAGDRGGEPPAGSVPPTPGGNGARPTDAGESRPDTGTSLFGPRAADAEPGTGTSPGLPRAESAAAQGASAVSAATGTEQQLGAPPAERPYADVLRESRQEDLAGLRQERTRLLRQYKDAGESPPQSDRSANAADSNLNTVRRKIAALERDLRPKTGPRIALTPLQPGVTETRPVGTGLLFGMRVNGQEIGKIGRDSGGQLYIVHNGASTDARFKTLAPAKAALLKTWQQDQSPPGKLQVLPQGRAAGPQRDPFSTAPLQLSEAQKVFRGQAVTQDDRTGNLHVTTTGGKHIEIAQVPRVGFENSEVRVGYGRDLQSGEQVVGRIQEVAPGFFRMELGPNGTILTFLHESGHFFEDAGILTSAHVEALNAEARRQGLDANAESRANVLAAALEKTLVRGTTPLGRAVLAVQRFFDKMARLFGMDPSVGSVTRRIQSGEIFRQVIATGSATRGAEEQYEIAPGDKRRAPQSTVVDAQGNLLPLYHGGTGNFQDFDVAFLGSAAGQIYSGFFFAEDATVASHYATYRRKDGTRATHAELVASLQDTITTYEAHLPQQHFEADLAERQGQTTKAHLRRSMIRELGEEIARLRQQMDTIGEAGPNVRPVYLDIRNPFDATQTFDEADLDPIRSAIDQRFGEGASDNAMDRMEDAMVMSNLLGSDVYKGFARYSQDEMGERIGVKGMTQALQDLGYDGLFHIGKQDGRVWVAFHPNQILPVFQPEARAPRFSVTGPEGQPAAATPQDEEQRTSVVPEATPRDIQQSGRQSDMGNPRTEWKLTFDYAGIANLFTPEQRTQIEAHFGEGRPLQRKETISNKELDEHAAQQIRRWDGDRDGYITFMQGLANNDYGPTDIQSQALRAIARENFEMGESLWRANIWSDDDFYQFEDRYFAQDNSLAFARQARSMAGRTLQAGQAPTDAEVYQDLRRRLREIEGQSPAEDIARLEAETKEAMKLGDYYRLRAVGKQIENPTLKEVWKEFYINSLLSSPATMSANLWSTNGYMLFKQALVRPAQGVIDKAFSVFTGRAQENFVQSGLPALGEFARGFTKQFQQAWWLFRNDARAAQIPDWQKSGEFGAMEKIRPASMRRAVDPRDPTRPLTWVRKMAPAFDWAGRVMEAMDVGMRGLAFDMNFAAMARDASLKLGLDAPRDRTSVSAWERQWMAEQMADPVTGKMSALAKQALDQAQRDIFRDAPSKFVLKLAQLGESKGFDLMSFMLFPFKYTPDRLLARGLELLPGNPYYLGGWAKRGFTGEWRGWMPVWKFDAATMGTSADSLMFAKQAVGLVMTGVLYGMWKDGLITGSAPDDPLERENFYREGKIPNAARVGDTWLSWRRFEPLSLPMGIATTVFEAIGRLEAKHERDGTTPANRAYDIASLGAVAGMAVKDFILDSSYFAGMAAFFAGTQRGREAGDLPSGVYRQIATTVTPLVGLQRSLIRASDALGALPGSVPGTTMIRQPKGMLDTMAGTGLPWALMGFPEPRLDVYGRGQSRDSSPLGEILPGTPPVARGHVQGGKREQEFETLRYFPGHMPQKDHLGIKYADDVYRQLELARGPWLLDQHDAIVESPSWDRWTPEQKLRKLRAITSEANRRARRQVLGPQAARAAAD